MFVTTSLCSPSRASILSGLYAHRHGVMNNFQLLPRRPPRLPTPGCARRRLRDRLHRQMAHGRERRAAHRLRFLDEPQGPGKLLRQRVQHRRHPADAQGLLHDRRDGPRGRVAQTQTGTAVPAGPRPQGPARRADRAGAEIRARLRQRENRKARQRRQLSRRRQASMAGAAIPHLARRRRAALRLQGPRQARPRYLGTILSVDDSVGRLYNALKRPASSTTR